MADRRPDGPSEFAPTHTPAEALALPEGTTGVRVRGQVVSLRILGKRVFGAVAGDGPSLPFMIERGGPSRREPWHPGLSDTIGVEGALFRTRPGQLTLRVERWVLIAGGGPDLDPERAGSTAPLGPDDPPRVPRRPGGAGAGGV